MDEGTKRGNKFFLVVILVVVVVLLVLWWTGRLSGIASSDYQAVFLTNNQVYFGKLSSPKSQYPVLREVYYLQITQTLQPREEAEQPIPNLNLIKLGGEIHGPSDRMFINRDQILFYEDLKPDSQVVTAIKQFKEGQQ